MASPSMVRSFFSHGATYALAGVLSQGIAFLLFPFFAHVFNPRDYGIIDLLGVLATLVNLTIALEVSQGLGRHFVVAAEEDRRSYASTALWFTVAVYSAFVAVGLLLAGPLTDLILGPDVNPEVMRVAVCGIWCAGLLYLMQDLLRWDLRPRAFALVSVTTAAVTTAASAIYVLALDWGVTGAIAGQLTGTTVAGALALALGRRRFALRFDRAHWREMVGYSLPLVPASVGVFLNGYADRVAIKSRLSLADVGLYGVGYRLSLIVGLTLLGFQGALMPLVLSRHEDPSTPPDLARVFRLFCAIALLVLLLASTFADELLRILTRPAYYGAETVVPLVVAAAFFAGMYIFAPGLNIAKRTRPFAVVTATAGVANLCLAFALVDPLGIEGAALAFLVTASGSFAALMLASQRLYPVPHDWRRLGLATAVVAGLTALGVALPPMEDGLTSILGKPAIVAAGVATIGALLVRADERRRLAIAVRSLGASVHRRGLRT
jgi:O-antigen/teichoic acid export membrane protein